MLAPSPTAQLAGLAAFAAAPQPALDRALASLAEVLAHRLRGPMAAIQGYTELLTDGLHAPEERDLALRVFEAVAAAETLLADLQRYALPLQPVPQAFPLARIFEEVRAVLPEVEDASVSLAPPAVLLADPVLLRQALLALLQNALEAAPSPEGVSVLGRPVEGGYRIEVWNEGGMDPDVAARAAEPFFTTKAQHLGLGLPLARRIVEAMGGGLALLAAGPDRTGWALSVPLRNADGTIGQPESAMV
jgi:two-component system, NtrC family, sensor histidine kinase HydH